MEIVAREAKMSGRVILILDEVHRLDKGKQDFLLPYLENGMIILIGATTANPYHAINPAIRSRTQIFELEPLTPELIKQAPNVRFMMSIGALAHILYLLMIRQWSILPMDAEEMFAPL